MAKAYNKHIVLEYLFFVKTANGKKNIGSNIDFTLYEIGDAIIKTGGIPPTSWSNFVLDLTRKKNDITARLPQSVINYGYDLRKKTGRVTGSTKDNYCGTFVYRGFDDDGNTIPIQDWLEWGAPDRTLSVTNTIPELVQKYISNDEASLFSVIDYCDILSKVLGKKIYRVQSPMKWQPNEIDGYYVAEDQRNTYVYPVEAKAISTADDISLVQINGQYNTFIKKYTKNEHSLIVRPIAAKMEKYGMLMAILEHNALYNPVTNKEADMFNVIEIVKVVLDKPLSAWQE